MHASNSESFGKVERKARNTARVRGNISQTRKFETRGGNRKKVG